MLDRDADLPANAGRSAVRRLRGGFVVAGALAFLLLGGTELPLREVLALPTLLVLLPAVAWAQLPLLTREALHRESVYLGSILTITLLGLGALGLGVWGFAPADLGLTGVAPGPLLGWVAGVTTGAILLGRAFEPVDRWFHGGPHPVLLQLLPRDRREKGVFVVLSVAAGWGEELAYRGYLPAALLLLVADPWVAIGIAAVAFGGLHSYQGGVGVVRTALMGFLLGVPLVLTGSLLPGMIAHALVDLIAGLVLGPRILRAAGAAPDGDR